MQFALLTVTAASEQLANTIKPREPMSHTPHHRCRSCRHWEARSSRSGLCRYAAPRSAVVLIGSDDPEVRVVWPTTEADDRCSAWTDQVRVVAKARRPIGIRAIEDRQPSQD